MGASCESNREWIWSSLELRFPGGLAYGDPLISSSVLPLGGGKVAAPLFGNATTPRAVRAKGPGFAQDNHNLFVLEGCLNFTSHSARTRFMHGEEVRLTRGSN